MMAYNSSFLAFMVVFFVVNVSCFVSLKTSFRGSCFVFSGWDSGSFFPESRALYPRFPISESGRSAIVGKFKVFPFWRLSQGF